MKRRFDFKSANEYLDDFYRSELMDALKNLLYQRSKLKRITVMINEQIDEEIDMICNKLMKIKKEDKGRKLMKKDEVYEKAKKMKEELYDFCKENEISMFVGVSNDGQKMLSGAANGKNTTLQIMICEFLIEIFDEEEILGIFAEFTKRKKPLTAISDKNKY